jgi:hypothetical protein
MSRTVIVILKYVDYNRHCNLATEGSCLHNGFSEILEAMKVKQNIIKHHLNSSE